MTAKLSSSLVAYHVTQATLNTSCFKCIDLRQSHWNYSVLRENYSRVEAQADAAIVQETKNQVIESQCNKEKKLTRINRTDQMLNGKK